MYPLIENRQIRVFISSTFEDMKPERDHLMKKVFPRLRKQAAERDVSLVEIDLRWGITQKQAERGEVLQICLNEIDNSHPFFIGLLGNRYGSSPKPQVLKQHPILKERYPWISEDVAKQLGFTEIEMQYGALRRNEKDLNAYFFIKDVTVDDPQQIALRDAVSNDSRYKHDKYTSVEDLGEKIEKEFGQLLDRLFPEKNLSQLELERLAQRAFRRSRCHVYVRNEPDFKRLNDFLDDNSRYLVVTGESGMGKSSLIANWLVDHEKDDRYNIIYHFVGNTGGEADHGRILSRLIDEIYDLYNIPRPDDDRLGMDRRKPEEVLQDLLMQASAMKPLLIVLDGINQLAESGKESPKLLNWLPSVPIGSKMLFSTLVDDETMATFKRRQYPIYKIKALDSKPRRELIVRYLKRYGKELTPAQVARIADDSENKNTLVLRTLLDELLCFGDYQLDGIIIYYLSAKSIDDFFQRVLQRAERDYGEDLVRDTLSLIAVSYAGMSENELIDMAHILPLQWSAFYCAFAAHFTVKNGLVNFSHRYLSDAVVARYLDCDTELSYRRRVIDYFATTKGGITIKSRYVFDPNEIEEDSRIWIELANQYYCGKFNNELHTLVIRPEVFVLLFNKDVGYLVSIWKQLMLDDQQKYSLNDYVDPQILDKYGVAKNWSIFSNFGVFIFKYFNELNIAERALSLALHFITKLDQGQKEKLKFEYAFLLDSLGTICAAQNRYSEAVKLYDKALGIRRYLALDKSFHYALNVVNTLTNLATVHYELEDYIIADNEYNEAINICNNLTIRNVDAINDKIAMLLINQGHLYIKFRKYELAKNCYIKAVDLYNQLSVKFPEVYNSDVVNSHHSLSVALCELQQYSQAKTESLKALNIARYLESVSPETNTIYTAICLMGLGDVYLGERCFTSAEKAYREALEKLKSLSKGSPNAYNNRIASVLCNLGLVNVGIPNFEKAEKLLLRAINVYSSLLVENNYAFYADLAFAISKLADLYDEMDQISSAESQYIKSLNIYKQLAQKNPEIYNSNIANILTLLGIIHLNQESYFLAEQEFKEALSLYITLSVEDPNIYDEEIADLHSLLGNFYNKKKYKSDAEREYLIAFDLYRHSLGDEDNCLLVLIELGKMHFFSNNFEAAEKYYCEYMSIVNDGRVSNIDYLVVVDVLVKLGKIYCLRGDYDNARQKYTDALNMLYLMEECEPGRFSEQIAKIFNDLRSCKRSDDKPVVAYKNRNNCSNFALVLILLVVVSLMIGSIMYIFL